MTISTLAFHELDKIYKYLWSPVLLTLHKAKISISINISFEDNEISLPDIKLLFIKTLMDWLSVWRNQSISSIFNLLDLCNFCIWFVHPIILLVYLGVSFFISINLYFLSKKKESNEQSQPILIDPTESFPMKHNRKHQILSHTPIGSWCQWTALKR